jgi:hypothetical protein
MAIHSSFSAGDVRLLALALGMGLGLVAAFLWAVAAAWGHQALENTRLQEGLFWGTERVTADIADGCLAAGAEGPVEAGEANASGGVAAEAAVRWYVPVSMLPALPGVREERR